mmetsp:Transcript_14742/g.45685  ORF Transcript_14742/g.45685 Transcript_14742/m.45685 type:complete len:330 (+) Transcript_14742:257-1246(+)
MALRHAQKRSCASAQSPSVAKPRAAAVPGSPPRPAMRSRPAPSPSWRMSAANTRTKCRCSGGPNSTQMPASRKHTAGVSASTTKMLPGWRSPWSRLSWKIILQTASTPIFARALRTRSSTPSGLFRKSRIDGPSTKSSTRTSSEVSAFRGAGKRTFRTRRKFSPRRSRCFASRRMSICAPSVAANSSAAPASENQRVCGARRSAARAHARNSSRSEATRRRAAGCTTLTATASPARPPSATSRRRVARWTWATQPVPTGRGSTSSVRCQSGPSARASARSVSAHACAGASSCRCANRSQNSFGKRSSRLDAHCASLMAVGPAAWVDQRK